MRSIIKRTMLIVILFVLLPTSSAVAAPFGQQDMRYFNEAESFWENQGLARPTCTPILETINGTEFGPNGELRGNMITIGWTNRRECRIQIVGRGWGGKAAVPCFRKSLIFHETGHLFGLEHTLTSGAIMYPKITGFLCSGHEESMWRVKGGGHEWAAR